MDRGRVRTRRLKCKWEEKRVCGSGQTTTTARRHGDPNRYGDLERKRRIRLPRLNDVRSRRREL